MRASLIFNDYPVAIVALSFNYELIELNDVDDDDQQNVEKIYADDITTAVCSLTGNSSLVFVLIFFSIEIERTELRYDKFTCFHSHCTIVLPVDYSLVTTSLQNALQISHQQKVRTRICNEKREKEKIIV